MTEKRVAKTYRFPASLVHRIDRFADRMQREAPVGIRISTTDVVVHLLTVALDQLEGSGHAG